MAAEQSRLVFGVNGKYQVATAAIFARLGPKLEADIELSGCSLELESELGQEKVKRSL